jgi:hypothetical protein
MPTLVVSLVLFAVSAFAQDKPPRLADLLVYANSLTAEGVWRADNLNEKTELAFDSVTRLECHKHGGRNLVDTDAYCAQMTVGVAGRFRNAEQGEHEEVPKPKSLCWS